MPRSTQSLRPCSKGSSMPQPDREAARLRAALVGRLHRARATAGDDRETGLGQCGAQRLALGVLRVVARGPGRAEDGDGTRQLGQHAEALDELGLDPQHPPRVGVHPVARATRVEQPLVGGGGLVAAFAAQHDRAPLSLFGGLLLVGVPVPAGGHGRQGSERGCQARKRRRTSARRGDLGGVDVLLAGVREVGVAGAVVDRRDAEGGEPRHVGPAVLGRRHRAGRGEELRAAGAASPGSAPGAMSVTSTVEPVEHLPHVVGRLGGVAVGGEAEVDGDHALVGDDVAGDPAGDARPPAVPPGTRSRRCRPRGPWYAVEPVEHGRGAGGSRCRRATTARSARGCRTCGPARAACPGSRPRRWPFVGSPRIARSARSQSACSRSIRPSPLRSASTSSQS